MIFGGFYTLKYNTVINKVLLYLNATLLLLH